MRFPTPPEDHARIVAAAQRHGVSLLASHAGVSQLTAARAVAGLGLFPTTRRALVQAAARLDSSASDAATRKGAA